MRENVADIFDEVAEDLRAERARNLMMRYGGLLVVAALLVLAGVGGWQGWRWYQGRQNARAAGVYLAAQHLADATGASADRLKTAATFEKLAKTAPGGYRTLARLRAAALLADAGKLPQAVALWDQVAHDSGTDPLLRGLADLMAASHQIDSGNPALVAARLKALAAPANPWHALAEEDLALLDIKRGDTAAAKKTLTTLANDPTAPSGARGRASGLLQRLGG